MSIESFVAPMRDHRAKLDGDTGSGTKVADAFSRASTSLGELDSRHDGMVRNALGGWYGQQAGLFQDQTAKVKGAMTTLAGNSTTAGTVAGSATVAVNTGRTAIDGLITEFIGKATPMLEAAATAAAHGDDGKAMTAYANVRKLADDYITKTGQALQKVRDQLTPLVGQLGQLKPLDSGAAGGLGGQLGPSPVATTSPSSVDVGTGPSGHTAPPAVGGGGHTGIGAGGHGGGGGGGGGGMSTAVGPHLPVAIPPQPGSGVGVNLPDGSSAEAPNTIAAAAVRNAMSALGTPYVWGASNPPAGTDCSGLTSWSYGLAGLQLPRHSAGQAIGASVPDPSQLLPGDLVVWDGHVAMIVGNGQLIEAGDPVQVNPIRTHNMGDPFLGFYRPTG